MTAPDVPEDFVDLVQSLNAEQCDFVVVGAHALAAHGAPRATGDLDVLVRPDVANSRRVYRALVNFGAPVLAHGVGQDDFAAPGTVYQMGLPPRRIDVLTSISASPSTRRSPSRSSAGWARRRFVASASMRSCATSARPGAPRTSPTPRRSRSCGPAAADARPHRRILSIHAARTNPSASRWGVRDSMAHSP